MDERDKLEQKHGLGQEHEHEKEHEHVHIRLHLHEHCFRHYIEKDNRSGHGQETTWTAIRKGTWTQTQA
jgi:hypothetical protein